jgi:hypothetical protein
LASFFSEPIAAMHLKDSAPEVSGYFVRPAPDAPERGPFTVDELRDLAEFKNIGADFLVRAANEEAVRPFGEWPELMAAVFPAKTAFRFKTFQKTEDPDAGYAPINARNINVCAPADLAGAPLTSTGARPPPLPGQGTPVSPPPLPPVDEAAGFDVKELLEASQVIARERSGGEAGGRSRAPFSAGRVFQTVRWICALFLVGAGIAILALGGAFWMAILPFGAAFLLVALDLVGWAMDGVENWTANAGGAPPDYTRADECFMAGDWGTAAAEFFVILKRRPKELRAYVAGIAAAVAAGDGKQLNVFHALAQTHLKSQDLNLLNGALMRRGIPPVPPAPRGELE